MKLWIRCGKSLFITVEAAYNDITAETIVISETDDDLLTFSVVVPFMLVQFNC